MNILCYPNWGKLAYSFYMIQNVGIKNKIRSFGH